MYLSRWPMFTDVSTAELSVLNGCRRAQGAEYRHGNRGGCLKGTRENVLNEIERWTEDCDGPPVFWLNGLAGTGKSTIAQTIAERTFADGRLGASFFCSRGIEDRSNLQLIFPTLAFQLAQKYSAFRTSLVPLLQSNPDVIHESLGDQMQKFLVKPLRLAGVSTVIVIDALDECRDEEPESAMLLVLGKSVSQIPGVKFIVTCRPETHIMAGFRGPLLKGLTNTFILHEVEPHIVGNDIRRFFVSELSGLAQRRGGGEGWPSDDQLDLLCRRAAGFFVYAVATVNFLKHRFKRPADRLEIIMKSPDNTAYEGKVELKVYASLDSLYTTILKEGFCKNGDEDDAMVRSVLSALVLVANPLSPSAIATLMGFECDEVLLLLESVQSLLALREDTDHPIQPFHKSFSDFITDPDRCTDLRFYIPPGYQAKLAICCLELMGKSLKRNMCWGPDYVLNSQVADLQERIKECGIRGGLEYACRSWHTHLQTKTDQIGDVISALRGFLEGKFLFWLEVLSVLGVVGDAARALDATMKWLNKVRLNSRIVRCLPTQAESQVQVSTDVDPLLDTTRDCLRFVTEFFEVISQSGTHIYRSAIQLAPRSSIVRKLYSHHIHSPLMPKIVTGVPDLWDSCTASIGVTGAAKRAVWSSCGRFVAVLLECNAQDRVEVRDSITLEVVSVLQPPSDHLPSRFTEPAFSPDGRLLACGYYG